MVHCQELPLAQAEGRPLRSVTEKLKKQFIWSFQKTFFCSFLHTKDLNIEVGNLEVTLLSVQPVLKTTMLNIEQRVRHRIYGYTHPACLPFTLASDPHLAVMPP